MKLKKIALNYSDRVMDLNNITLYPNSTHRSGLVKYLETGETFIVKGESSFNICHTAGVFGNATNTYDCHLKFNPIDGSLEMLSVDLTDQISPDGIGQMLIEQFGSTYSFILNNDDQIELLTAFGCNYVVETLADALQCAKTELEEINLDSELAEVESEFVDSFTNQIRESLERAYNDSVVSIITEAWEDFMEYYREFPIAA